MSTPNERHPPPTSWSMSNEANLGSPGQEPESSSWTPTPTPGPYMTPRQPLSRRQSRAADPTPAHHLASEPSSYFSARPISPTLSRRIQSQSGPSGQGQSLNTTGTYSYQRPGSSASYRDHRRSQAQRSTSVSSTRPRHSMRGDTAGFLSEAEEDEDGLEESRTFREGIPRTPGPRIEPEADDDPSSDDLEAEAERAEGASEAGSVDPVTLLVSCFFHDLSSSGLLLTLSLTKGRRDSLSSTYSILLACLSGSQLCTKNRELSLAKQSMPSTPILPLHQSNTYCREMCFG